MSRISSYTLIEMVMVLVIIGLITMLVLTRVVGTPRRMAVESALSDIRTAFSETAMGARASGRIKGLILDPDSHVMQVTDVTDELDITWRPAGIDRFEVSGDDYQSQYVLPDSIEWNELPDSGEYGGLVGIRYLFFPDGQAAGDDVEFSIHGRQFYWSVDRVLGRVVIYERD